MNEVVITGLGFVTSIGHDRRSVVESLREGRCGIKPWNPIAGESLPVRVAGTVIGFDVEGTDPAAWTWPAQWDLDRRLVRSLPPHGVYAVCALEQALAEAGLERRDLDGGNTGLACASGGSPRLMRHHLDRMAAAGWRRGHPLGVVATVAGTLNFNLGAHYGIRGTSCGFVSACTSSSHALGAAFDEIQLGRQDRMLVVGAEDLALETLLPFHAMGALSLEADPACASRPFDQAPDGFVGAGGAVALVLEDAEVARRRGAQVQARMLGWGQAADGFDVAAPHPTGDGLARAITRTLGGAGISAGVVTYVNAHATSTIAGDRAEALALRQAFAGTTPAVSSTKALTGHGLSMAGAMEAAFCVLALTEGFIPGQFHLTRPIPEAEGLDLPRASRCCRPGIALNCNSGFGGTNVCHVFTIPN